MEGGWQNGGSLRIVSGGALHFLSEVPSILAVHPVLDNSPEDSMPLVPLPAPGADRRRWAALIVVCLAQLMIVLDVTIVNVALPAIQHDLDFSQTGLTWIVNAFLVPFGSLLLLAGRLADLAGRRRIFLSGVATFTVASLLCGGAASQGMLIAARALQGVGAAAQASVILAIIITEFPEPAERA